MLRGFYDELERVLHGMDEWIKGTKWDTSF